MPRRSCSTRSHFRPRTDNFVKHLAPSQLKANAMEAAAKQMKTRNAPTEFSTNRRPSARVANRVFLTGLPRRAKIAEWAGVVTHRHSAATSQDASGGLRRRSFGSARPCIAGRLVLSEDTGPLHQYQRGAENGNGGVANHACYRSLIGTEEYATS